jgi:hypothetical protein
LLIYFFIKKPTAPLYHKAPAAVEAEKSFPLFDKIKELFSAKKDDSTEAKKDEKPEENGEENKENEE